jgi:DNA polymerase zeta
VNHYTAKLTRSLNHAISVSLKRNPHSPNSQYIRSILMVKGVHFYGFHSSYSPFLKILITDPALVNRAATIMQSGTVMHTRFRVFESHLSFPLQFMSDFGLYGCGWIDLGEVLQRGSEKDHGLADHEPLIDDIRTNSTSFDPSPHFRQSHMPLELDVVAHQILNRHLIATRNIHHKLEIPAPPLPVEPLVLSVRELWEDERQRRRLKGLNSAPEIPVDPSEKSRGTGGGWVAEARWWEEIRKRIERERETMATAATGKTVGAKSSGGGWENWVMTAFESVEALWEVPWKVWKPEESNDGTTDTDQPGDKDPVETPVGGSAPWNLGNAEETADIDVDETLLSSQEMSQLVEGEEADWEDLIAEYDFQQVGEEKDETAYDYDDPPDPDNDLAPGLDQGDSNDPGIDRSSQRSVTKV